MSADEPQVDAAELALGVLDGEERAAALRRMLAEPAFAADVAWWRDQLATLVDDLPATEPPPGLFARIEQGLAPLDMAPVAPMRRAFWPGVAGLTSLAAAAMLAIVVLRPDPAPIAAPRSAPAPLLAAAIAPTEAGEPLSAVYDPAAGSLRVTAAALATPRRSAELWVIGSDGVPHSLGLLNPGAATALSVAPGNRARIAAAAVLAISVEPLGGSRTGLPTGPVVAKGTLNRT